MDQLIITLDGPAGSGKSTVARQVAKRLGLEFLDTGAMYRAVAALCVQQGIDPSQQPQSVAELVGKIQLRFDWQTDPPRLLVETDGQVTDLTDQLRNPAVTSKVSQVASITAVRQVLVAAQQQIGREHPRLVSEGRDQGSAVFTHAQVKFYLDATPEVRARRRADQLIQAGQNVDPQQILHEIVSRDEHDSTRTHDPLICPDDAVVLDTSRMPLDQVVDIVEQKVRQLIGAELEANG